MRGRVLAESRRLRFICFGTLYAGQGVPDAMVLIVLPAYLAANGAGAGAIAAFLAAAMLPNAAKLLVGPMVDRLGYLPMGRRRPWLMAGQLGIAASFAALAGLSDPVHDIALLTAGAFAVTLATVFQDVATDATAMDIIPAAEQGQANGIMWGAKTLGTAVAASGGAALLAFAGFTAMMTAAALLLLAIFGLVCVVRERAGERLLPWTAGAASSGAAQARPERWGDVARSVAAALRRPLVFRLLLLSLAIGLIVGMTGTLAPILMVRQFGWEQIDYASFRSTLKLASGVAGLLLGGMAIGQFGHRGVLVAAFGMLAVANLWLAAGLGSNPAAAYLVAYEFLLVFIFVTFFAATMSQCVPAIAATQFSITMVCGNITMSLGAALVAPLIAAGGPRLILAVIALVALAAMAIMAGWKAVPPARPS